MLALGLNVINNVRHARFADAENAVTVLPLERTHIRKGLMNPPRRFAFQPLNYLARCELRSSQYQNVDMILDAADLNSDDLVFSRDTTDVCPDALLDLRADEILAALCREDDDRRDLNMCSP